MVRQKQAEQQGIMSRLWILRSLQPYDWKAIVRTVKKTNKVIVAHEDSLSFATVLRLRRALLTKLFEYLDAPVRRVALLDTFVAYAPQLEDAILPQVADV